MIVYDSVVSDVNTVSSFYELSYVWNYHISYWVRIFYVEKRVVFHIVQKEHDY